MTSPNVRCTSAEAEIMTALVPSYRAMIAGVRLTPDESAAEDGAAATGCACVPGNVRDGDVETTCEVIEDDCPTSCCNTGSNLSASACCRKTTLISDPAAARLSRSTMMVAKRATARASPRSAIEFELSIGEIATVPRGPPAVDSACSDVAISRAPALRSGITRVSALSLSRRDKSWRTRRMLSAKSATIRLFAVAFAVTDPSRLTSGRTVSTACAASRARNRNISVTKLLRAAPASPTRPGWAATLSIGWIRNPPLPVGTATRPLARSVERNTSKYSDFDIGRSLTTETFPCTR